jgi:rhodanese-related sulfurtransferase
VTGPRRALLVAAIVLGGLALLADRPKQELDFGALADDVIHERDHVTGAELAAWIRDRKPGLRVLDVRSAADFAALHIPGAVHMPLDALVTGRFDPADTLVLYSEGGTHAAQGWVFLRARGYRRVYFLRGGINEWLDATPAETTRKGC